MTQTLPKTGKVRAATDPEIGATGEGGTMTAFGSREQSPGLIRGKILMTVALGMIR